VQRGVVVIPKSENEGRMRANLGVRTSPFLSRLRLTAAEVLKLSDDNMRALDALHTKEDNHRSLLDYYKTLLLFRAVESILDLETPIDQTLEVTGHLTGLPPKA
jgi:hypothetical protein